MYEPLNIQLTTRELFMTRESGNVTGAWLKLPATAEQLTAALARIGAQGGEHGRDYFINGIETPVAVFDKISLDNIQKAGIDELNYLAAALQARDDNQINKLNAAIEIMGGVDDIHRFTELTQNTGVYDFHPDIFNNIQLGEHTFEHSGLIQIPDEWAAAVDREMLGRLANEHEKGMFTEYGYIVPNGEEWKPVNEIPQEYQITPKRENPDIDYDAITATATTPAQAQTAAVIPLVLTADNPRDRMKEITAKLENGIKDIFESEQYKSYLNTLSKFHNYSLNNCMLIAMQKPDASHVAGFNAWRDDFKRPVKKGEKGMKIIAPAPFKTTKEVDRMDADGNPVLDANGRRVKDKTEVTVPSYTVVTVFDVSQTDGEPLPQIGVSELTGSVDKYKDFLAALEKTSNVPIGFEAITSGAKGYYHQQEKRIAINEGMSELQNLKTAIHEIAHSRLHAIDTEIPLKGQNLPDRRAREVEAESIAYTVCQHYGLDTSDYSFGYVATWSGDKQLDTLKASLDTIRKEADAIISEVDKHFAEIIQDKEQTAERQPGFETWSEPATPENAPDNPGVPSDDISAYLPPQGEPQTMTTYYSISEDAARRAKEANSFSDYRQGSATAEYRQSVDEAVKIAEQQKSCVDPMYHAKIDRLVDTYARKLAENMNHRNSIDARVPSIMIAGGSNFPVRQKEKQNAARDTNMREWQDIQGLLDKIRSTGMGGISADDPNAIKKLQSKLENLEQSQETMKSVNAYYRKNKTLDGCPDLSADTIAKLKASMSRSWRHDPKPFEAYALSNNNAEIHRTKGRIEQLTRHSVAVYVGWQIDGGRVEPNQKDNRLQVIFDGKPDEAIRNELKSNGFRWSPNAGAWQRQLNDNAIYAADRIKCIQPITGEKPTELQRAARSEAARPIQQPDERQDEPELQGGTFTIYQLKGGEKTRNLRFEPLDRLAAAGLAVALANYDNVYSAPISEDTGSLGMIYEKFNLDHPEDFRGHSLSVSDVVVMNRDGQETAFYVDNIGFKELPDFLNPAPELAPNQHIENIDGLDFVFTTATPQQSEPPHDNRVEIHSAVNSNYKDMVALVGADEKVYLGKSENYHFITPAPMPWHEPGDKFELGNEPSYYDNSDKSLLFVSDNQQMYIFLYTDGWIKSQADMLKDGIFTQADYKEFARIQSEVVNGLPYKDNFTGIKFDGKPFDPKPVQPIDLHAVADYMQKQYEYANAADPNKQTAAATVNIITRRLEQTNERIPGEHPQLKALLTHAAQSPDLTALKERMNTLQTEFTQHYSTAVQNTVDTSGKAEPKAPAAAVRQTDTPPAPKAPAQGENVAAIEAKVKAGETINLSDLSDAIKKDKAAQTAPTTAKPPARTNTQGKTAPKTEQPSIKEKIAAGKQEIAAQKSAPAKAAAQNKNKGLGD